MIDQIPELKNIIKNQIIKESEITGDVSRVCSNERYFTIVFKDGRFASYNIDCSYEGGGEYGAYVSLKPMFDHTSKDFIKSLSEAGAIDSRIADKQIGVIEKHYNEIREREELREYKRIQQKHNL